MRRELTCREGVAETAGAESKDGGGVYICAAGRGRARLAVLDIPSTAAAESNTGTARVSGNFMQSSPWLLTGWVKSAATGSVRPPPGMPDAGWLLSVVMAQSRTHRDALCPIHRYYNKFSLQFQVVENLP